MYRLSLIIFCVTFFSCGNRSENDNSNLRNNLSYLNGKWSWRDKKNEETWWLTICLDSDNRKGSYNINMRQDDWASKTENKTESINSGNFIIEQGYDMYGDKAYVAKDSKNNHISFLITQLENKYATDWLLKIGDIQDQQFGEGMNKISNNCK